MVKKQACIWFYSLDAVMMKCQAFHLQFTSTVTNEVISALNLGVSFLIWVLMETDKECTTEIFCYKILHNFNQLGLKSNQLK